MSIPIIAALLLLIITFILLIIVVIPFTIGLAILMFTFRITKEIKFNPTYLEDVKNVDKDPLRKATKELNLLGFVHVGDYSYSLNILNTSLVRIFLNENNLDQAFIHFYKLSNDYYENYIEFKTIFDDKKEVITNNEKTFPFMVRGGNIQKFYNKPKITDIKTLYDFHVEKTSFKPFRWARTEIINFPEKFIYDLIESLEFNLKKKNLRFNNNTKQFNLTLKGAFLICAGNFLYKKFKLIK